MPKNFRVRPGPPDARRDHPGPLDSCPVHGRTAVCRSNPPGTFRSGPPLRVRAPDEGGSVRDGKSPAEIPLANSGRCSSVVRIASATSRASFSLSFRSRSRRTESSSPVFWASCRLVELMCFPLGCRAAPHAASAGCASHATRSYWRVKGVARRTGTGQWLIPSGTPGRARAASV